MAQILCQNLTFFYEESAPLFSHLNYTFDSTKCTAIVGPSGSGKTTLLHLIAQWKLPSSGQILRQRSQSECTELDFFRYVFSSPNLINELTIEENMFLDRPKTSEALSLYQSLLAHFSLSTPGSSWPNTLSSGQQQRVGMIRALMGDALFLLADEPTSHLDPVRAQNLMQTLITHLKAAQRGLICVTHDRNLLPLFDAVLSLDVSTPSDLP